MLSFRGVERERGKRGALNLKLAENFAKEVDVCRLGFVKKVRVLLAANPTFRLIRKFRVSAAIVTLGVIIFKNFNVPRGWTLRNRTSREYSPDLGKLGLRTPDCSPGKVPRKRWGPRGNQVQLNPVQVRGAVGAQSW